MPNSPTADFDQVPVRGQFVDILAAPIVGSIVFTPRAVRMIDVAAKITILGRPKTVTLDGTGALSTLLPASDDPDISQEFSYLVEEKFPGGETYDIVVPIASKDTGIDLSEAPRVEPYFRATSSTPSSGGITVTDNGDGTVTFTGTGVTDNLDGTLTLAGPEVTDNLDGTLTVVG